MPRPPADRRIVRASLLPPVVRGKCRFEGSSSHEPLDISAVSTTPPCAFVGYGRICLVRNTVITSIVIIT